MALRERLKERCPNCGWLEMWLIQVSPSATEWHKFCEWCKSIFGPFV